MNLKHFTKFILFLFLFISAIGCDKEVVGPDDNEPVVKENYKLEVNPESLTFSAEGGEQDVVIKATKSTATILNGDTIENKVEDVDYTTTITGEGFSISENTVTAEANTVEEREGSLIISVTGTQLSKTVRLTQEAADPDPNPDANPEHYSLLLSGASFATPNNGWFELACEEMGVTAINKAGSGTAIADMANQISTGELYSHEQLENLSALVIMHAVNNDVFLEEGLHENYYDYPLPFDRSNYAAGFDYVIKRFYDDCYQLKFDESSKYYDTKNGKTPVIILCTDWHDARTTYNNSVRKLAAKWDIPLVEFDVNIGFTRLIKDPVTGLHMSRKYSPDTQTINGEVFGWHPHRGKDQYIQQLMASIFTKKIREVFPALEPSGSTIDPLPGIIY